MFIFIFWGEKQEMLCSGRPMKKSWKKLDCSGRPGQAPVLARPSLERRDPLYSTQTVRGHMVSQSYEFRVLLTPCFEELWVQLPL